LIGIIIVQKKHTMNKSQAWIIQKIL
jgi:hypothetical protein